MDWQIICDFDGTIANEDVTDGLLERFAGSAWLAIEAAWQAGEISARECMMQQVDLLRTEQENIDAYLGTVEIDPEFAAFCDFCCVKELKLQVVSDGLDYVIHNILGRWGLGHLPVIANRFEAIGDGRYRMSFPHFRKDCGAGSGTCKCAVARQTGAGSRLTLLIGDGSSDYCLATCADLVLAKDKLLNFCRRRRLPHHGFTNFGEAREVLELALRSESAQSFDRTISVEEDILNG